MKNSHDIDLITKFSPQPHQQPQQTAQQHPHHHFTPIRSFEEHNPLQQKIIDPLMLSNDLSSIDEENDPNSLEDDQERNDLLEQLSSSNSFLLSTSAAGGESGDDDDSEIKNYTTTDTTNDLSEHPYLLQGVSSPPQAIWGTTHHQATIGPNTAKTTEELIGDLPTDWQVLSSKTNNPQHYLPQQQQHQVITTTTNGQTMMNLLNDNVLIQNNNNNSNNSIIYNGQNNSNNNNSNDSNNINHVNSRSSSSSSSSMNSISTNINRMNINIGTTSTPNVQQPQQPIQYPTTNNHNNTFQQQQQQSYFNQPQQQQFNQSTSIASSSSSSQSSSSSSSSPSMASSLFITPSQVHQLNNNHYSSGGGGGGAASNVLSNDMLFGNSSMMSMLSNNNNNSNTTITTPVNDEMCTCPLRSLLNCPWYGNKLSLTVHLEQSCFPRFLRENITAAENGLPQQPQHILFKVRDNIVAGMNQYFSRETILRNCAKQLQVPEVVCAEVWKWMRSSNESFFHAYDMITLVVGQIEIFNELAQEMQANQDTRYHFNDPNVGLLLSQQQQQQQTQSQVQQQLQPQQQFLLQNESPMVGHQTTDSSNGATLSLDLSNQLLRQNYSQALTQTAGSQLPNSNASQQWSLLSQFQQMQQQTTLENNNNGRSSSAALVSPTTALSSRNQQVWIPQATSSMTTNPMMNSGIAMGGASAVGTTTPSNISPLMVNQFVSGGAMANSRMRKDVTKSKALKFHNYKQPTATTPGGGSSRRRSESSTPISFVNYSVANPRNNNNSQ